VNNIDTNDKNVILEIEAHVLKGVFHIMDRIERQIKDLNMSELSKNMLLGDIIVIKKLIELGTKVKKEI